VAIVVGGLAVSQTGTQAAIEKLPAEVTLAFASGGNSIDRWMQEARRKGHEILMQVPLEPFDYPSVNPGRHTLTVDAGPEENADRLYRSLARTTNYTGVMNYMGGRFVTDGAAMSPFFGELAQRGLMYLDDGSSARSLASDMALRAGVPYASGDTVIDAERERGAILRKLDDAERTHLFNLATTGGSSRMVRPDPEYPHTRVLALFESLQETIPAVASAADMVTNLVFGMSNEIVVVLGAETSHGCAYVGVSVPRPLQQQFGNNPRRRAADPMTKGFRASHIPKEIFAKRFLSSPAVLRGVERADSAWIHGRGQDSRAFSLRPCRVMVLGCGSIGGPVAIALAQAGVGNLDLVDSEALCWANVGRHPLGAEFVEVNKAVALGQKIERQLPHITKICARNVSWQDMYQSNNTCFESFDLIVSTIGDWGAEAALNTWHQREGRCPIVYGWTEPF
jgi:polysaccharide deacetylase 2 family uncharacterized protein YibQ